MTQPRKVVMIIVQLIVEPLIGLRQERILEKQVCGECVIDHWVGSARKV